MPRTAVAVTTLVPATPAGLPAGTAIDAANSHVVTLPRPATPAELILIVKNTTAAIKTVTVKAGVNPPGVLAGGGDMTALSLADGSVTPTYGIIGPFTAARYLQADGTINVDVAAAMTGTIAAVVVPRTA